MNIKEIQYKLSEGNGLALCDIDELKYVQKPIGKGIYEFALDNKSKNKQKANWNDKVKCKVCGSITLRSNQSEHKKSKKHLLYENINGKLRELLIE